MIQLNPDMESVLDIFISECNELCAKMGDVLGRAAEGFSSGDINELFRVVHTLKGSCGLMGIDTVARLSHALEDILHTCREDSSTLVGREEALVDLLYAYLDFVSDDVVRLGDPATYVATDPEALIKAAQKLMAPDSAAQPPLPASQPADQPDSQAINRPDSHGASDKQGAHQLTVRFTADCVMPAARAILIIRHITPQCSFLHHEPEDFFVNPDEADERIRRDGLVLDFDCADPEALRRFILASSEVQSCETPTPSSPSPSEVTKSAEPTPELPEQTETPGQMRSESSVNVSVAKIDAMQQLVMELSTTHYALERQVGAADAQTLDLLEQQQKIIRDLEEAVIFAGMSPLDRIRSQIQRMVRDISRELNKQVELVATGGEIEVDHSLIERLPQFLPHLLRNAMDHGIEQPEERARLGKPATGTLHVDCEHRGNEIVLTVSDDGRGLNRARIAERAKARGLLPDKETLSDEDLFGLVLLPGFSTKEKPTIYSGRGVGMDAVQKTIGDMGGRLHISSEEGAGTSIRIALPISLTLVESLLFSSGGISFLLPVLNVRHISAFREAAGKGTRDAAIFWEGEYLPLIRLDALCERQSSFPEADRILILVEGVHRTAALVVDTLSGIRKIIVKGLPDLVSERLRARSGIMGFGVMGDGTLAYMLSAEALIQASAR